ncbi:MAG: pyrimidine dimer DNA glycosylase [archaeon]|nr:MAG: pyrimidine dimer DNA glycosylase [archaeon]
MRIWDIHVKNLCRQHLLGEHNELHAMWSIITKDLKGFCNHPETKRWRGKLKALYKKHEEIINEMERRGYNHKSCLDKKKARGKSFQDYKWQSVKKQKELLKKRCKFCKV